MYSYGEPLVSTLVIADTTASAPVVLPCAGIGATSDGKVRSLDAATVLGLAGVVKTAGALTIQIGDGVTATRYGTAVFDATVTAGKAAKAVLNLTEEGFRMGVGDDVEPTTFTLTFVGAGAITNLAVIVGRY